MTRALEGMAALLGAGVVVDERIERHLTFVAEVDRLKTILRRTTIGDGSRRENSAEHSWHLALMATLLAEYAAEPIEFSRAVRMLLVHDIVEIDAGDTFCYDEAASLDKEARETLAADRIFSILPDDQARELRALWDEFEAASSPDARFAVALDRLQPLLQNLSTDGGTWRLHGVERARVRARMEPIREALPGVWPFVEHALERAAREGWVT